MSGHGHVIPNEDGSKAPCGGLPFCKVCYEEFTGHSGGDWGGNFPSQIYPSTGELNIPTAGGVVVDLDEDARTLSFTVSIPLDDIDTLRNALLVLMEKKTQTHISIREVK